MALGKIDPKKLWQGLKKYRYAALVLLLGLGAPAAAGREKDDAEVQRGCFGGADGLCGRRRSGG